MVVVLALVALLGAVVMPGLLKMQEAWKRRIDMQDIADQLRSLGYRARLEATDVVIGREGVWPGRMLDLRPAGPCRPSHLWCFAAMVPVWGGQVDLIRGGGGGSPQAGCPLVPAEPLMSRRQAGFTLLEAVVAMTLLVVV
ncbi:hypothetical protein D0N87_10340, partial [Pseudomonas sp. ATCC 13867]